MHDLQLIYQRGLYVTLVFISSRVAGGIMAHLRFKAIFLQYGSNETKIIIAIILGNIISNEMLGARHVNLIMFLTK